MCMTTEAFALFLNLIGLGLATSAPDTITIRAQSGDVEWHRVSDEWCTSAPLAKHTPTFLDGQPA